MSKKKRQKVQNIEGNPFANASTPEQIERVWARLLKDGKPLSEASIKKLGINVKGVQSDHKD